MPGGVYGGQACMIGGMHGRAGVRGRGHAWQGVCVVGGMRGRRDSH